MKDFASGTAVGATASAAIVSFVCTFFVPYGYPWPSLAWALLACAAAVWVATGANAPKRSMSHVISDVEAEPAQPPAAPERGVMSARAIS